MTPAGSCGLCRSFDGDPAAMERAFPGLASLGSGYGSVRGRDGICRRHDLYLPARATCADFSPASAPAAETPGVSAR